MTRFPLGARGEHPVFFPAQLSWERIKEITGLPGVVKVPGGLACTWDVAPLLAQQLGVDAPKPPIEEWMTDEEVQAEVMQFPGLARYRALGLGQRLRDYQKDGATFLARRSYAINADPMRSGKSLQSLAASVLVDAQRTLIVAPALAKWVWADEIAKWVGEEALVLEGRSGTMLRRYCRTCMAKGKLPDGSVCGSCKLRNGQANGFKIYDVRDLLGPNPETGKGAKGCTKHKQVPVPTEDFDQRSCPECERELHEAIDASRYVIVNYDLLVAQKAKDGSGRGFYRDDLQGWGPALSRHRFDLCIADESHMLRGWESSPAKKGTTRREKFCQVTEYIDRVWLLSGTPIYGYVRDLWGQMDAMSKGALTSKDRLPFMFHARYCLPGDTKIWMEDLSFRDIASIRVGEAVMGWSWPGERNARKKFHGTKVLDVFSRRAPVIEVQLASGRIVRCTPDHVWASGRAWANSANGQRWTRAELATSAEQRREDGTFASGNDRWGACLAHVVDVTPTRSIDGMDYARGYAHGALDGDGTVRDDWHMRPGRDVAERVLDISLRVKDEEFALRYAAMLRVLAVPANEARKGDTYSVWSGREGVALYYLPREGTEDYWRGYLAGIYDAEGSGYVFAQYRARNPAVYDNITVALARFAFDWHESEEAVTLRGGREAFVRFWNLVRPAITRKAIGINQNRSAVSGIVSNWQGDEVVAIRDLGEMDVWCLKTETANFVADGYASHNCEGHRDDYGWRADGRSFYADAELPLRLKVFQIKRPRSEILSAMPPKVRQTVRIDDTRSSSSKVPRFGKDESTAGRVSKLLKGTFDVKIDAVVENVLGELANEGKVVVFTLLRESAERMGRAIEKESRKKENSTRMQQVDCKIWLAHGETSTQSRFAMARAFREHQGAGVFITTIDAVQVAVSLKGAQSVHFAEMHWQPSAMLQAEDRPYEVGVTGLNILYYLVRGSVDEHIEQVVLPKVETLARVVDERTAVDVKNALLKDTEESVDDLLASLTAHLKGIGSGEDDE